MGNKSGQMENLVGKLISETLRNKKVFVTGHTGFKGSWLLAILKRFGANVKGYALAPENDFDLYTILNAGEELCESVIHDIRDKGRLQKEILDFVPDFIFHLAAQPLVRTSYEDPIETFEVNVMGTAYVLECARSLSNKCTVVIVTTDKVYHNNETVRPYKESDPLGGYDPYSASKAAAEIVTSSYSKSFFNPTHYEKHYKAVATARAGNVIGGGDWAKDRVVPDLIRALESGNELTIRNPDAVRPWQHVLEPLFGYLVLACRLHHDAAAFSGGWNFGPAENDAFTVRELAERAIKNWGSGEYSIHKTENQPHEAGLLTLDISKAVLQLGWKPKLDAAQSIEWALDWYKQPGENRKQYTFFQIDQYISL